MKPKQITIDKLTLPYYEVNTLIIGSGAAALKAAVSLHDRGVTSMAIATDRWGGGSSNNAGSDKQTYYKLSLAGDQEDSVRSMADDLYAGGCMHGDIALVEAVHSAQCFYDLVRLGVPFPHNAFGEYIGYQTDHDTKGRATSAGPLTSHLMFEALAREVKRKRITVLDRLQVIELLTEEEEDERRVVGAIALDTNRPEEDYGLVVIQAENVILGTGGPAGMYATSVYPASQTGSTGLALKIGATAQNLTESQFGIASITFRWNLSGSYQQAIPRYVSTDGDGNDEREFLNDYFPNAGTLAQAIFLKGYQWPFDPHKVLNYGSSLIDLLVYQETVTKERRVFLDYRHNFEGFNIQELGQEATIYLASSYALQKEPIERLHSLNSPAIALYRDHGIDLTQEMVEIAVCAQHSNGGLKGNLWWESNIRHLFPVGEANGSHGVQRPGGAALNAGQVGALRAAMFIAHRYQDKPVQTALFFSKHHTSIKQVIAAVQKMMRKGKRKRWATELDAIRQRMSTYAGIIRRRDDIAQAAVEAREQYQRLQQELVVGSAAELPSAFQLLDICLTHMVYLEAIREYTGRGGKSRGCYLIPDKQGTKPCEQLDDSWTFSLANDDEIVHQAILEVEMNGRGEIDKRWTPARPLPGGKDWFERIWEEYREDQIIR